MNYSTAVFLINRDLRAVAATYDADSPLAKPGKRTMFKTLDHSIRKDDLVVVPTETRHGYTVVKVVEVDVSVDFDDAAQVAWVVARVDVEPHKRRVEDEAQAIETLKRAEFRKRRQTLFSDLVADQDDEIKRLPLYKNGDEPAPRPPIPRTAATPTSEPAPPPEWPSPTSGPPYRAVPRNED